MRRVSVVGNAGSGKSTLARRLAATLDVPHIEIDAINHLPGWQELDRSELRNRVDDLTTGDGWVVDGNYRECVVDGPVWGTQHGKYTARYGSAMTSPTYAHLDFVRVTSRAGAEALLAGLAEG